MSTTTPTRGSASALIAVSVPAAPPLPDDLEALLRRLRLPHIRRLAPEVLATAKAQRWEPAEVLRALFAEEAAGRERSALATRRTAAAFPTGKDLRRVEGRVQLDPGTDPASSTHPGMGAPTGEPRRLRPVRDRQDVPA